MQELKKELTKYKIHIAAFQEIIWKENEKMDFGEFTLFKNGEQSRLESGIHQKIRGVEKARSTKKKKK